jgi:hypothetical protein
VQGGGRRSGGEFVHMPVGRSGWMDGDPAAVPARLVHLWRARLPVRRTAVGPRVLPRHGHLVVEWNAE